MTHRGRAGFALVLSSGAVSLAVLAAAAPAAQQVFRTSTDMVFLNVTATRAGRPAGGLTQEQFVVFEDGRPQTIQIFAREAQPIALSILFDASVSMETKLDVATTAAVGFTQRMRPEDVAQVVTFSADTEIRQPFTDNKALLETAIRSIQASGSTSLYTAMYIAFSELERIARQSRDRVRRQAIVVLSDGEDTTSLLRYEEVVDRAKRSDVIVFAIGLRDRSRPFGGASEYDFVLRTLAQTTGGRAFFVNEAAQLPDVYTQIADELAGQYTLGYVSANPRRDGEWRAVQVRINQPGVVARTRSGYFGPSK